VVEDDFIGSVAPEGQPEAEAALKPPPILTPGAVLSLVAGAVIIFVASALPDFVGGERAIFVGTIAVLALAPLYFSWRLHQSSGPRSLALFADRLVLPINARASHRLSVRFGEVTGILLHESGVRGFLLIGTGRYDFVYPLRSFERIAEARAFVAALRGRLRDALPHGERRVDAFDAEGARTAQAMMRRPWALAGIVVAMGVGALIQAGLGGFDAPFSSVGVGALSRPLVWAGEVHRIVAHVFVQPSVLLLPGAVDGLLSSGGFVIHGLALMVVGAPIERLLGPRFALVLFATGTLTGAAFVIAANDSALVHGAGAAFFAFVGSMVLLNQVAKDRVPLGFRLSPRYLFWALLFGIIIVRLSYSTPLDVALGGFLAGVVTTAAVASGPLPRITAPAWVRWVSVSAVVVFAAGATFAWVRAGPVEPETLRTVIERHRDPQRLNAHAWTVALDAEATAVDLDIAESAARRSLGILADTAGEPAVEDTLATVLYRRGQPGRAAELQRAVLAAHDNDVFASQLARFSLAALSAGEAQTSTAAPIRLSAALGADGRVRVRARPVGDGRPHTVFAVVHDGATIGGLLRVGLAQGMTQEEEIVLDTPRALTWTGSSTVSVAAVVAGLSTSKAWPMDPEVAEYP
jgi:hypothetical protein